MTVDERIEILTSALRDLLMRGPFRRDGYVVMEVGRHYEGKSITFPTSGDARAFVAFVEHVPGLLSDVRGLLVGYKRLEEAFRRSSSDELLSLRAENAQLRRELESVTGAIGRGIAAIEATHAENEP